MAAGTLVAATILQIRFPLRREGVASSVDDLERPVGEHGDRRRGRAAAFASTAFCNAVTDIPKWPELQGRVVGVVGVRALHPSVRVSFTAGFPVSAVAAALLSSVHARDAGDPLVGLAVGVGAGMVVGVALTAGADVAARSSDASGTRANIPRRTVRLPRRRFATCRVGA